MNLIAKLGPFVRKRKLPIILVWILFLTISIPFALDLRGSSEASDVFFLENSESKMADDYISEHFDQYAADELLLIIIAKDHNASVLDDNLLKSQLAIFSQNDQLSSEISMTSVYSIETAILYMYNFMLGDWINGTLKLSVRELLHNASNDIEWLKTQGFNQTEAISLAMQNVTIAIQLLTQEIETKLPSYIPEVPFSFEQIADLNTILLELYNASRPVDEIIDEISISICANATILVKEYVPPPSLSSGTFPVGLLQQYVSDDGQAMLVMFASSDAWTERSVRDLREAIHSDSGLASLSESYEFYLTGEAAIQFELQEYINEDVEKIDRVTIILVLLLLTLVFLSVVAPAVPVLTIGMALICGHSALWLFSQTTDVPTLMLSVMTVVAFGAGVDYIIFILNRYKEERLNGKNEDESIDLAIHHSGESVVSSGMTVMVGFGSLALSSFLFLRFMGLGPLVSIVFALLAALTFIPATLSLIGDGIFWPRKFDKLDKGDNWAQKLWNKARLPDLESMGRFIVRHPKKVILALLILSLPFLFQATRLQPSYDISNNLPMGAESSTGLEVVADHFSDGRVTPIQVLIQLDAPIMNGSDYKIAVLDSIEALARSIEGRPYVDMIQTITRPLGNTIPYNEELDPVNSSAMATYVSNDAQHVLMSVLLSVPPMSNEGFSHLEEIRQILNDEAKDDPNIQRLMFGGAPSSYKEMADMLGQEEPFMMVFVLVGIFIILLALLRSLLTPIRLEFTILFSVLITLGATQFVFVELLGESVPWIVPIMLFVVLFGLGMDYDIFLVTRMKEEVYKKGKTDEEAIITALSKTGHIIMTCGIIMSFALGTLMISSNQILKVIGFAFFVAILLDAFVIRLFMVPAIMMVFGRWNWWLPFSKGARFDKRGDSNLNNEKKTSETSNSSL
ncbi:MAG: MMPL family transporter [Candidatus Thorarchaeota archaeon]